MVRRWRWRQRGSCSCDLIASPDGCWRDPNRSIVALYAVLLTLPLSYSVQSSFLPALTSSHWGILKPLCRQRPPLTLRHDLRPRPHKPHNAKYSTRRKRADTGVDPNAGPMQVAASRAQDASASRPACQDSQPDHGESHTDARADFALVLRESDEENGRQGNEDAAEEAEEERFGDQAACVLDGDHAEEDDADACSSYFLISNCRERLTSMGRAGHTWSDDIRGADLVCQPIRYRPPKHRCRIENRHEVE